MVFLADPAQMLSEFGQRMGIPGVVFDEDGYCCLGFDDVLLNLELNEQAQHVIVSSEVGSLQPQPPEALLSRYLALNHAALIMGLGGIGVNEDRRVIMYVDRIPLRGLDVETLEAEIARFVDRVEVLKTALASPDLASDDLSASDSARLINLTSSAC